MSSSLKFIGRWLPFYFETAPPSDNSLKSWKFISNNSDLKHLFFSFEPLTGASMLGSFQVPLSSLRHSLAAKRRQKEANVGRRTRRGQIQTSVSEIKRPKHQTQTKMGLFFKIRKYLKVTAVKVSHLNMFCIKVPHTDFRSTDDSQQLKPTLSSVIWHQSSFLTKLQRQKQRALVMLCVWSLF